MKILIFIIFLLISPSSVSAAVLRVESEQSIIGPGGTLTATIWLDTEGASVNAVEGIVTYPADLLQMVDVGDGNSAVSVWVERPTLIADGAISFSGGTPGGFTGGHYLLFTLHFKTKATGVVSIDLEQLRVLKNDGLGTTIKTVSESLPISVIQTTTPDSRPAPPDVDPPETFTPSIAADPAIFNGRSFLVFSTTDKGSGVSAYEIREGKWGRPVRTTSPYVLKGTLFSRTIYVTAIDAVGNERTASLSRPQPLPWYESLLILGILISVLIIVLMIKKAWLRHE